MGRKWSDGVMEWWSDEEPAGVPAWLAPPWLHHSNTPMFRLSSQPPPPDFTVGPEAGFDGAVVDQGPLQPAEQFK
jgi:hypothetical protein